MTIYNILAKYRSIPLIGLFNLFVLVKNEILRDFFDRTTVQKANLWE